LFYFPEVTPLAMAWEIKMRALSFQANARGKERKRRKFQV